MAPDAADVRRRGHFVQAEEKQFPLVGEPRVVHHFVERVAGVDCAVLGGVCVSVAWCIRRKCIRLDEYRFDLFYCFCDFCLPRPAVAEAVSAKAQASVASARRTISGGVLVVLIPDCVLGKRGYRCGDICEWSFHCLSREGFQLNPSLLPQPHLLHQPRGAGRMPSGRPVSLSGKFNTQAVRSRLNRLVA